MHVYATELRAAQIRRPDGSATAIAPSQLAAVAKWAPVEAGGEDWFGFSSVRAMPGARDDVLLIPLPGHSRGHCGVAVWTAEGWLLHCGDAYFHHAEVAPAAAARPPGVRRFEVARECRQRGSRRQPETAAGSSRAITAAK